MEHPNFSSSKPISDESHYYDLRCSAENITDALHCLTCCPENIYSNIDAVF